MSSINKKVESAAAMEASKTNVSSMETQSSSGGGGGRKGKKRGCKICICSTLLVILLIFIIFLILGFTVFKPKRPTTTVDSVSVERLRASADPLNFKVVLNLTLHVDVSLKNPNRVGFSYDSSSALLNYRGQLIGEAPLPANRIAPRETQVMNLTLTLMADRLLTESQLLTDVMSDVIPLNTFVKVSGKVKVLKIFTFNVHSSTSCDLTVSISNRNVTRQNCSVCCIVSAIIVAILFLIFLIAIILALTLYETKEPITRIQSARSATVQCTTWNKSSSPFIQLNFTLELRFLVENRNRASVKHGIGKTLVLYEEKQVGEVDLPAGTFPAKISSSLPCHLKLQIDKFAVETSIFGLHPRPRDFVVETMTMIPGKVKLFGIFNKYVVVLSDCKIIISYPSMKVQNQECEMTTKL